MPLTALRAATLTDVKVARIKEELFGDVSTITPVKDGNVGTIAPVKNDTNWELTIGMATPLGNATVEIALTGSYVLRFDKAGAMIDDGKTQKDITYLGGSISYPDPDSSDIVVVVPAAAIGSPAGLSPTDWQSSGGDWALTIDMATPLGDATVEIALTGSYVLRFDKAGAVVDNGVTQSNLTDIGVPSPIR